ncbi:helix-turn-helix domain-containing protein [Burkholderia cepacia]|uniref:helix-turn-helix domain-containing protein n=1 Tax=Burkholderia cepacia TaxID=292 RepID=UPI00157B1699|nr:helix-turn-helix domain-containing protein [Burkholderia cepacia]NTX44858.1 helix-turn-helix domain-containing protein [Burkholderia cepacia]
MTKVSPKDQPSTGDAQPARRLTTAEAAVLLGRSPEAVLHLGMTGRLARERGDRRSWTYAESDVLALKVTMADPEDRLTTAACARHLGLSRTTVLHLARLGNIPSILGKKGPGGGRTFKRADVEQYGATRHLYNWRADAIARIRSERRELERQNVQQPAQPTQPAPAQRFVLPDVMRNWPILDDRDREPRRPGYGAEG